MTCYSLERFKKRIRRYDIEGFGVEMRDPCCIHLYRRNSTKRIEIDVAIINSVENYLNYLKRIKE